ncbi:MAG: 4,5-DOPA dioxygenase extradiol [Lachnospiraceae bacterium]|nr:4,5-DOPA dioxygenase extradiol [Lachnospiraceae bacterium]
MPVIFSGHGSPMLALEDTDVTHGLKTLGTKIMEKFGKPKAILAVSAHWYTRGTFVQSMENPKQVYDMYGFPQALYDFKYPVKGDTALADRVLSLLGDRVSVNNDWGIDHGTWTVLCHVFPEADIPVVQLSVDGTLTKDEIYEIGKSLTPLRDEGYLIFASGNVVHNLRRVEWENPNGSPKCTAFNDAITEYVLERNDKAVMEYEAVPNAAYAVPTPEHYLPLIYMLGAAEGEKATVFNNHCELGAIAMTGYAFGLSGLSA